MTDYRRVFCSVFPGFFEREDVLGLPHDLVLEELVLDCRKPLPKALEAEGKVEGQVTFEEYRGELSALHQAVSLVEPDWVKYFQKGGRFYVAKEQERIVSFCAMSSFGRVEGLLVGGPGCVGTLPLYRKRGIGLEMVRRASRLMAGGAYDLLWIHYTGIGAWYRRLGYQTAVKWNQGGFVE